MGERVDQNAEAIVRAKLISHTDPWMQVGSSNLLNPMYVFLLLLFKKKRYLTVLLEHLYHISKYF